MRVHEIAGRVNLRDAMFLRRVAKMLALVPVVEEVVAQEKEARR